MTIKNKDKETPILHDAPSKRGISLVDDEEGNEYAKSVDAGHKVDPRVQKIFIMVVALVVLYFVGLIIPKDIINESLHVSGYNAGYSFSWFTEDLASNINGLLGVFTGHDDPIVPFSSTMILYIVVAVTGAGLALTGGMYQGSFKNALVSPSTLGVTSGANIGLIVWIVFFVAEDGSNVAWVTAYQGGTDCFSYLWSMYSLSIISFVGCCVVVCTVVAIFKIGGKGGQSTIMMIIAGQVIASVIGAVTNSVRYWYVTDNPYGVKASLLTDLSISSFYRSYTWIDILAIGIPLIIAFVVVYRLSSKMMMMSFDEGEARTMGVDTRRMQVVIVGVGTLLTAVLISFAGRIGFVGFLVPHMARRLVGPNFKYLMPATACMGALFVLAAYLLVSITLGSSYESMVGMFISIGGSAVFLITALRGKGGVRGEFRQ